MTLAECSMTALALLNGGRIVAYVPQILCIYRDRNGAAAVSLTTWAMFAAGNLATVSYSLTVSGDVVVASVFALNAACCLAIMCLAACRRFGSAHSAGAIHERHDCPWGQSRSSTLARLYRRYDRLQYQPTAHDAQRTGRVCGTRHFRG
jgi:hypothetical protein